MPLFIMPAMDYLQSLRTHHPKAAPGSPRLKRIRNCIFLSGLSVFAQLYLFQPVLSNLCRDFSISPAMSSLAVSFSTIGMATGLFIWAFKADTLKREKLMAFSLIASALITLLTALAWNFPIILALSLLKGIALSGVSAVALAYLNEEVSPAVIGVAISLYLSGNTIGGMSGRVCGALIAGWSNWHFSALFIGLTALIIGIVFAKRFPASLHFHPQHTPFKIKLRRMGSFLTRFSFLGLFLTAALILGAFVSIYNYISFILESPVFNLPHYIVAMVFLMYITGVAGSMCIGKLSDRYDAALLLKLSLLVMLCGILLLLIMKLWAMIAGLGLMTFAFSGANAMSSRLVSIRAHRAKSSATCLYWLFYYIGSSLIGSSSGTILSTHGWNVFVIAIAGIVLLALVLSTIATRHPLASATSESSRTRA